LNHLIRGFDLVLDGIQASKIPNVGIRWGSVSDHRRREYRSKAILETETVLRRSSLATHSNTRSNL